jgi:hypothetical protein
MYEMYIPFYCNIFYELKGTEMKTKYIGLVLIIGVFILLRIILTVNNTFCFTTIDKVFYYVASVLMTCSALILGHHQVNLQNIKKEALFIQRIRCVE